MSHARPTIFGRASELADIDAFLDIAPDGARALRIEGEAGIGKTTLWTEAVRLAQADGWRVLVSSASERETGLAFTVLSDLLRDALDEVADRLQPPLRRSIDVALLRVEAADVRPDPRAVGMATFEVLRYLAEHARLLLAIDDVQWVDAPSARALSFAVRRSRNESLAVVAALRLGGGLDDRLELDRSIPAERLRWLRERALDETSVTRILARRTNAGVPTTVARRIHEASGGNPLFALELARTIEREAIEPLPGEPLPVPRDLDRLLRSRIRSVSPATRDLLLIVSVAGRPTTSSVHALGISPDAIGEAERNELIEAVGGYVRFTHPLFGSAVYAEAGAEQRRIVHRRLSAAVTDRIERARHLALSTEGTDARVAAELDEAAEMAQRRGAPAVASELSELASRLTPPEEPDAARARAAAAADRLFEAGDVSRAVARLEEEVGRAPAGPVKAELLHRMSRFLWNDIGSIRALLDRAFSEAGDAPPAWLRMRLHRAMGWVENIGGDLRIGARHHDESLSLAEASGETAEITLSLAGAAYLDFMIGQPRAMAFAERAMAGESELTGMQLLTSPRRIHGALLMWTGELDAARRELERDYRHLVELGHLSMLCDALVFMAELELRAGNWDLAARYAAEGLDIVREVPQEEAREVHLWSNSLVAAHRGETETARALATEGLAIAEQHRDLFHVLTNGSALGFLDLSLGDAKGADEHLGPLVELAERMGIEEPGILPLFSDEIEALIALGELDEGESLLERIEVQGKSRNRALALAWAARCRGLLAAARGDLETASDAVDEALEHHTRIPQPFDLARTLLVQGQVLRRMKRKRPAREVLERALRTFEQLGARLWAAKARAELGRIGGRAPSPLGLTPTEREVAGLVGQGMTNRDVAAALFMSEHTVRANLKRIYPKLGIRSRTELAARLKEDQEIPTP